MMQAEFQQEIFHTDIWYPGQIELFDKQEDLSTAEWAETHERWVQVSDKPGPWKHENNPALKGLMDLMDYARKLFVLVKGVQTGGTEAAHNYICRRADTSAGAIGLYVMDAEKKLKRIINTRVIPAFEKTPKLKQRMSHNPDDTTNYSIKLQNGFVLNGAWATSQSMTSSDPCIFVVIDEIDKSKDAINIQEAKDRITIYDREGKVVILSTPSFEDGPIMRELRDCEVIYDYHVGCPDCGAMQIMKFDNFTWPGKDKPPETEEAKKKLANEIERDELAEYICSSCGVLWDEYTRIKALYFGEWLPRHSINKRPISIGAVYPSWNSTFKKMSTIVAGWIRSQGDSGKLRGLYNNEAAEPFIESQQGDSLKEDDLYKRRYAFAPVGANGGSPAWQVPMSACILSASADIQANRIEACTIAWGKGFESWLIERVVLPGDTTQPQVWQDLDRYLLKEWQHESGAKLKIITAGIDSGYLAPDVYRFVRPRQLGRRIYATKGSSTVGKPLIFVTDPRKKKGMDRNKVVLINIGTEMAKDTIFARLQIEAPGPGYVHFSDVLDYDFFKQLCAEQCLTKYKGGRPYRIWEKKRIDARNEALDLFVGNLAVIELLNPNFEIIKEQFKQTIQTKPKDDIEKEKPVKKSFVQKSNRKGGWVKGWK